MVTEFWLRAPAVGGVDAARVTGHLKAPSDHVPLTCVRTSDLLTFSTVLSLPWLPLVPPFRGPRVAENRPPGDRF
jgi:hypothetical protein